MNRVKEILSAPHIIIFTCLATLIVTAAIPSLSSKGNGNGRSTVGTQSLLSKITPDLQDQIAKLSSTDNVDIILQLSTKPGGQLLTVLKRNGVKVTGNFTNLDSLAVTLPVSSVYDLTVFDEVQFINADCNAKAVGFVTSTTGADQVRSQITPAGGKYTLDGTGVGVAFLDSGIYAAHKAFVDSKKNSRIVLSKDFTGENRTDDPYGHGTHVAATAVGNGDAWNGEFTGIAPNARIINLRVLNSQGIGKTSQILAALDWVYQNKDNANYNIKVVNMSLGSPAINSYMTDALCLAVRKLVNAGIVVVTAAGNNGKDSSGNKQYGLIHSPGNEPSALTVGAANGFGTESRTDDGVTTFSSRGPTRSFYSDASGVRHYDNIIKPDIVALGNKVISAEALNNYLVLKNPSLETNISSGSAMKLMYLNGTSVAAPMVTGAVALLMQLNPKMTPNMVKTVLMYTAQSIKGFNTLEQGAGLLNVEGAVRFAKLIRTDLTSSTPTGAPLLTGTSPAPVTTIATTTFPWSRGIVINHSIVYGDELSTSYQQSYSLGILMSDGFIENTDSVSIDPSMTTSGILMSDGILMADGNFLSSGTMFLPDDYLLAGGILMSDGILLSDGILISDQWVVSDMFLRADATSVASLSFINGDN